MVLYVNIKEVFFVDSLSKKNIICDEKNYRLSYMHSSSALDARSGRTDAGLEKIFWMTARIFPPQLMELFLTLLETRHRKLSVKPVTGSNVK